MNKKMGSKQIAAPSLRDQRVSCKSTSFSCVMENTTIPNSSVT